MGPSLNEALGGALRLGELFGPAAAVSLLFALVLLVLYRRDHMARRQDACEDRAALLDVVVKNTASGDRLAEAVNRLAETNRSSAEAYTRQIDSIVRLMRDERRPR